VVRRLLAAGLAGLLVLLAGCTGRPHPVPPPPAPSVPAGSSAHTMTVGGLARTYRLYRPAGLPTPAPLVVVLHGAAGTGRQAEESYGWDAQADAGRFLVAYPDGIRRSWDVTADCCGVAARDHVDDVAFIGQLVASFGGAVATGRVYGTGISNGALLAYRLACDTRVFAAIGPVAGTMINPCPAPAPISVIHIHGTADRTIPYHGGPGRRSNAGADARLPARIDGPSVPSLNATWRRTDACAPPSTQVSGPVTTSVATCPGGLAVELVTVAGAGHQWPGGRPAPLAQQVLGLDPPSEALRATPVIWDFFAAHPRR
jgi:polyhydroxybutyrate depolymerase